MSHAHPASKQELSLWNGQTVASALPHKFSDTGFEVADLDFSCGKCGTKFDNTQVRGTISNLIARVLDFNVIGKCPSCGFMTPFRIRVSSDRICTWYNSANHTWQRFYIYPPNRSGVKDAFKDLIKAASARFTFFKD